MAHSAYSHGSILSYCKKIPDIHWHSSPLLKYQEVVQKQKNIFLLCPVVHLILAIFRFAHDYIFVLFLYTALRLLPTMTSQR